MLGNDPPRRRGLSRTALARVSGAHARAARGSSTSCLWTGATGGDDRYGIALEEAWAQGEEVHSMDPFIDKLEARGKAEGKAEQKREIIISMLEEGLDVAVVARISGLSEEQVLDIARGAAPEA